MYYVGIDIGSTASKVAVLKNNCNQENIRGEEIVHLIVLPTGWSGVETSVQILKTLELKGINKSNAVFAGTGYGRVSIEYANTTITEISCHARGANFIFKSDGTVIDIGGQDTKVIKMKNGKVENFLMNDKCSAGTGRFLELMANSLGCSIKTLFDESEKGENGGVVISSMCTVFAESEVTGLKASSKKREDIAFGIVTSVSNKVASLSKKMEGDIYFLTGGLCMFPYITTLLSKELKKNVITDSKAQFAGAIGAALIAKDKTENIQ